jgi:hypothetical protein
MNKTHPAILLILAGILILIAWALGKSLGLIHSPVWVEMIPVFAIAVTLTGVGIAIGKLLQKMDRVLADIHDIKYKTDHLTERVVKLESNV